MYVCFIFIAIFVGFSVGTAPIISYHFGAQNVSELRSLLRKGVLLITMFALLMLAAGELFARPLSALYVGYDENLMQMTLRGFRIISLSFLFSAIPIFGSSFFTALNDGKTSAIISFLRTMVFQVAAVLLLPMLFDLDGIWISLVVSELAATVVTAVFWLVKQPKFGY